MLQPRPGPRRAPRTGSLTLAAGVALLSLVLAACGSQLDPATVARVNGTTAGGVQGGSALGGGAGTQAGGGTTSAGGTSTAGGGSGSTGGGSSASGATGGGGTTQGSGDNAATGGGKGGSCAGFKNGPGITDSTITIGNSSDISGPVPGLFEASQDAVEAYVAYFNATSDICGRKLELKSYDSRTDASADQQAYTKACDETFAMVGSMSAFDSGGASTAQSCGLPDLRSAAVTGDRDRCTTCFGAQSTVATEFENAVPDYVIKNHPDAAKHAAMLYINAGAAAENGKLQAEAMGKRGMHFDYVQGIDISEFNYAPYVQQMKDKGVEYVQMIASTAQFVRLAQAMQQQGFKPEVFMLDPTAYTKDYVESGGDAVEGTTLFINFTPFEEASSNKEEQLYLSWLQQVKPGAEPSFFGLFSWSAARLFVERATALGGKLSRPALISDVAKVDGWTANGLHSPQHVGPKHTGDCWRFIQLQHGRWVPVGGTKYTCNGVTTVG
ncbi:ABC-type branched-subunit amino acid transport system substrate-binding protein [Nocardioides ginsengisegetis]|uniref:ABC-type branched-subunit amino acid transport system substrate-binding protein n=1 Tax=Nocardioides ginsengisegetis TaxID=661491 RepID=A0A7W3IWH3_9ACTN|nr:ABC transporter substrate-binding protein [Nocardioides ginsengisegetis]MBA8801921.1 ABC-type branched-subunit amino acid transport system substrate-binding protein [Nocardioides ginsengisegetis]